MYTRRNFLGRGIAAGALLLGGTGLSGAHETGEAYQVGDPAASATVDVGAGIVGQQFDPKVVHVEVGGTVTWEWIGGSHDTTAYHPDAYGEQQRIPEGADPWASGILEADGDAFEWTFDAPGVYNYVCTQHVDQAMVGSVLVGWPDLADAPGLSAHPDTMPGSASVEYEEQNEVIRETLRLGEDGECTHLGGGHDVCDLDGDGEFRDLNGDVRVDFDDVEAYFGNMTKARMQDNATAFDYNGNQRIDSNDVVTLFEEL